MSIAVSKKALAFALALAIAGAAYIVLSGDASRDMLPQASAASVDYFLKIDGIDGESSDDKHKEWIDVLSWSWGMSQGGAATAGRGGAGAGKMKFDEFTFTKQIDKASPQLLLACASGQHIKEATLQVRKAGSDRDYYTITLEDVLCTSKMEKGENASLPTEQISLNYEKIKVEYVQDRADGSAEAPVKAGWDIKANKKI